MALARLDNGSRDMHHSVKPVKGSKTPSEEGNLITGRELLSSFFTPQTRQMTPVFILCWEGLFFPFFFSHMDLKISKKKKFRQVREVS